VLYRLSTLNHICKIIEVLFEMHSRHQKWGSKKCSVSR
jgi:hypothetical protein